MRLFSVFSMITAILISMQIFAAESVDPVSVYLRAGHEQNIMAIGEGKAYCKYGPTIFLVDNCPQAEPDFLTDINDLEKMSVIPENSFDKIMLCNIPTTEFNVHPKETFQNISRILKVGGILEFNNMWGGSDAEHIKSMLLKNQNSEEGHQAVTKMSAKNIVSFLRSKNQLNPFDQYLSEKDFAQMGGQKFTATPLWEEYIQQLNDFFIGAGFATVSFEESTCSWRVQK